MDTALHQILHVIVDGEIADGRLPFFRLFSDGGGDEAAKECEAEIKVVHIYLQTSSQVPLTDNYSVENK